MSRPDRTWLRSSTSLPALVFGLWVACCQSAPAATLLLKDGRRLQGRLGKVAGLAENPLAPKAGGPPTITFVDDDLRRVFFPTFRILKVLESDAGEVREKIGIDQRVARNANAKVHRVGPLVQKTPFDDHGHRTVTMMTDKGPLDVVQGITILTPTYIKVEGMQAGKKPVMWDMRISFSSIPREAIKALLARRIDPKNLDQRLKVVRLFMQADQFQDAQKELAAVIADFPNLEPQDQERLTAQVLGLTQLRARRAVEEINVRRKAGQYALSKAMLESFPAKDVAGEILQQVREMLDEMQATQQAIDQIHGDLASHVAKITDTTTRSQCEQLLKELYDELNGNTLNRMASYQRLSDDASLSGEQKVALAISGWLLGGQDAETNLYVVLSLAKIRSIVERYLVEPAKLERNNLSSQLRGLEGASPAMVAKLLANMRPPLESPAPSVGQPGFYKLQVPIGIDKEPDVTYCVQLPPQYDPHVRYPTIVTLNGNVTTPEQQIDWWAGAQDGNGNRLGQATRFGYIVMAVDWLKEGQREYEFSAREHAAVLASFRDACRRFSIDTDRVFLSGHSLGGDAAWDLGLAHPDLWAGVIPIVAEAQKYCKLYWGNAELVPFYVLGGEMDGEKTVKNAETLDRYMTHRYDVTVTEYIGRGHEDFYEDILNIFDWMGRREPRNFFPKQFTVSTMRTWDNYFWWVEADKMPERGMVEPTDWPPARGVRPVEISGRILATNGLSIKTAAKKVTVWLSPEVLDFNRPVSIKINERSLNGSRVEPDLNVLLEDARTRADRLHPFWAKVGD